MLLFSCKRALRFAAHGSFQRSRGTPNLIVSTRRNYSCKENICNDGISALRCTTPALVASAGSIYKNCFQARTLHCCGTHDQVDSETIRPLPSEENGAKMPSVLLDGALCPPKTSASCPHGQQGIENDVACDRTFCPPERGEHCPLAHQGLIQPRGHQSLARQLDGGIHNLKRSLKCPRAYHALFVDAAGTLIHASQSTQQIYHEIGLKYGVQFTEEEIAAKYKAAYGHPWCRYRMRYEDDGRFYWQRIVQEATGCKDPALLEDLYRYYCTEKAWHIGDPDAETALKAIKRAGIKLAVVSNFDTRLRPLMRVLQCYDWFDTIIVSAEVGLEKPNPEIFMTACKELGVKPEQVLHVGDDETNDIVGASAAGCDSLLWGVEVASFAEVAKKLGVKV